MTTKTLCIRISDDEYNFISYLAKEEREGVSQTVRELVDTGRVMKAIEKYKTQGVSIEKAAKIAGVSISKMMDILREYKIELNLDFEDYLTSLNSIRKIW